MSSSGGNRILAALPPGELAFVRDKLMPATVTSGQVLYEQHASIDAVYFPETAVLSLVNRMRNGAVVEVGTIGNEGIVGLSLFLGAKKSLTETLAQIPGDTQRMTASDFRTALKELP